MNAGLFELRAEGGQRLHLHFTGIDGGTSAPRKPLPLTSWPVTSATVAADILIEKQLCGNSNERRRDYCGWKVIFMESRTLIERNK